MKNLEDTSWSDNKRKLTLKDVLSIANKNSIIEFPVEELRDKIERFFNKGGIDQSRVENADLKFPILLLKINDNIMILDGNHRCLKAIQLNQKYVRSRIVFISQIPEKFQGIFK